jgi:Vam6/Vps39-like protein vacuolar protein sorting-associated protein 39
MRDRLQPSISYLQRLGPEYLDQIFTHSRWMFELDPNMAFEVCERTGDANIHANPMIRFLRPKKSSYLAGLLRTFWNP